MNHHFHFRTNAEFVLRHQSDLEPLAQVVHGHRPVPESGSFMFRESQKIELTFSDPDEFSDAHLGLVLFNSSTDAHLQP